MTSEQQILLSKGAQAAHLELDRSRSPPFHSASNNSDSAPFSSANVTFANDFNMPLSAERADSRLHELELNNRNDGNCTIKKNTGANVFQTSLNITKMCMGTGTLALPFAAEKGGLLFNVLGLGVIGLWNFYSTICLLRCLEFLPPTDNTNESRNDYEQCTLLAANSENISCAYEMNQQRKYGSMHGNLDQYHKEKPGIEAQSHHKLDQIYANPPPPPEGTTTYGTVAWYASGPKGKLLELSSLQT